MPLHNRSDALAQGAACAVVHWGMKHEREIEAVALQLDAALTEIDGHEQIVDDLVLAYAEISRWTLESVALIGEELQPPTKSTLHLLRALPAMVVQTLG